MPNYPGAPRPRPRRRKIPKWKRFLRRYGPSMVLLLLVVVCTTTVILTISAITGMVNSLNDAPVLNAPPTSTAPVQTDPPTDPVIDSALAEAEAFAAGYDYFSAIDLLEALENGEADPRVAQTLAEYKAENSKLISYEDLDGITHIFFHSLIVDPARAFDGDNEQNGYNMYMVTVSEFKAILQNMYDKGYVLVSPYDIAHEVVDEQGSHMVYGNIRLPEGKTPFLMSQDDVNYYGYMIGTGNGKDETPVFADTNGDGFAHRIVIGADGYPTCEYMDANGNVTTGDYDLVPVLESFIQEHPDFSYHGARAILGVTGYEGVFGYRTKPSYETTIGTEAYQKEVEEAKKVAQCLKEKGWILASHSYGHPAYGNIDATRVEADSQKWENTVQSVIGETDIILFPHGSDINTFHPYTEENAKFNALYAHGYRYFFNVDSKVSWCQVGETYFRASRRNVDGFRMFHQPERLADLFDVSKVFDPARPTPVPDNGPGM